MFSVAVFFGLIGVSLSLDAIGCDNSFVGKDCQSNDECPDCLQCCPERHKCHGRTYTGDYVVPVCGCNKDVWADTYDQADAYCKGRYGTELPTIVAEYDKNTFIQIMNAAEQEICAGDCGHLHSTYIGLNDRQQEGNFVWADGTACETNDGKCIEYWAVGEPAQLGIDNSDDCVWFSWDTSELSHDIGCHNKNHIACNKPHPFIDHGHNTGLNAMNYVAPVPAKVGILNNNDDVIINKHTDNYNGYYNILISGFILFILINNIFVCYWCVCKNNYKKILKVDFNDEENL